MKIEIRQARKDYKCDYSGQHIKAGVKYKRVNIAGVGIFHFAVNIPDKKIHKVIDSKCFDEFLDNLNGEYMYYGDNNDIYF